MNKMIVMQPDFDKQFNKFLKSIKVKPEFFRPTDCDEKVYQLEVNNYQYEQILCLNYVHTVTETPMFYPSNSGGW